MLRRLFLKLLLVTLPVWAVLLLYVWQDPFSVVHRYDSYYGAKDSSIVVSKNLDFVATQTLIQNYPRYHYDSYIFGGSRSGYYKVAQWLRYLPAGSSPYHFNGNSETLYGVERKVAYLERNNMPIRNAIIVMDHEMLKGTENTKDYLSIKHPALSQEGWLAFHKPFIQGFFDRKFLVAWCDYKLNGKVEPYMLKDGTLHRSYVWYNNRYNELTMQSLADSQRINPERFYKARERFFYKRPDKEQKAPVVIQDVQLKMLQHIANVLYKNSAHYKIIINPLYDQVKLNPADLDVLQRLFGKDNVYDLSGKNDITESKYNYYENSHYSPEVAARIMDSVYKNR